MTFHDREEERGALTTAFETPDHEIDVVGLSPIDDRILFTECKWTAEPVGTGLVEKLRVKTKHVRWGPESREERFALFSKSGFTDSLEQEVDDSWTLVDFGGLRADAISYQLRHSALYSFCYGGYD